MVFNPFPDEQLNLLGIVPKQVCHFSSLCIFCLGCNTISRRAVRRLIVLHRKQNIESELKWLTCLARCPAKFGCSSGKGLTSNCYNYVHALTRLRMTLLYCLCHSFACG